MYRSTLLTISASLLLLGCPAEENNTTDPTTDMGSTSTDQGTGTDQGTTQDMGTTNTDTGGSTDTGGAADMGGGGDPEVILINPDQCYEFSNDIDIPLALDGVFDASSALWRRPNDPADVCPASELLPTDKAQVPYLAVKFCNTDTVEHTYDFEFLGQEGPNAEAPLDDAYLVLYDGEELPADHKQCLAANDDIEGAIDAGDSEILGVTVPSGGAVTVVATTFTFDPTDGTGTGGYILIVSNAD